MSNAVNPANFVFSEDAINEVSRQFKESQKCSGKKAEWAERASIANLNAITEVIVEIAPLPRGGDDVAEKEQGRTSSKFKAEVTGQISQYTDDAFAKRLWENSRKFVQVFNVPSQATRECVTTILEDNDINTFEALKRAVDDRVSLTDIEKVVRKFVGGETVTGKFRSAKKEISEAIAKKENELVKGVVAEMTA